jgi:hypothetical protein
MGAGFESGHELAPKLGVHDLADIGKCNDFGVLRDVADFGGQTGRNVAAVIGKISDEPAPKANEERAGST